MGQATCLECNKGARLLKITFLLLQFAFLLFSSLFADDFNAILTGSASSCEVGQTIGLSYYVRLPKGEIADFEWSADRGTISLTQVAGEVDYTAPDTPGKAVITGKAISKGREEVKTIEVNILPKGALKKTVSILIEIDTKTLTNVFVNTDHPSESFHAPLKIKGTFSYDETTGMATAGGNWLLYTMYDDGTHGDINAGDGIWSIRMEFEKNRH